MKSRPFSKKKMHADITGVEGFENILMWSEPTTRSGEMI